MDEQGPGAQVTPPAAGRDNDGEAREHSAGGVVVQSGRVLLVRVRNLRNEFVWTFPKGHVEEGETARQAAQREVEEETGYRCRVIKPIFTARYGFQRGGRRIRKRVQWYWMEAGAKLGRPDEAEIHAVQWVSFRKAEGMLRYPSDMDLMARTRRRFEAKDEAKGGRPGKAG